MRGKRLFQELKQTKVVAQSKRGRNDMLIAKRNECLVARYYFYTNFSDKNYEDIISCLVTEFFISPNRIGDLIQEQLQVLTAVKEAQPSIYFFNNHWPHFKW